MIETVRVCASRGGGRDKRKERPFEAEGIARLGACCKNRGVVFREKAGSGNPWLFDWMLERLLTSMKGDREA